MNSLFFSTPATLDQHFPSAIPNHMAAVALSVAESALESGPNSPTYHQSMAQMMDAIPMAACDDPQVPTFPALRHKSSFAGRPLWDVVEHAKERREKKSALPARPARHATFSQDMDIDSIFGGATPDDQSQEVIVTPRSTDMSQMEPSVRLQELQNALTRLSTRDMTASCEIKTPTPTTVHHRTRSDVSGAPSEVLRSQSNHRPLARLPSLAEIKAKMTTRTGATSPDSARRPNGRSDSLDSNDSEGPRTPTEEWTAFDFRLPGVPATPDTPSTSRLAPFLRERTNGRLARPNSMPPLNTMNPYRGICPPSPESPRRSPGASPTRQHSLPNTPKSLRRLPARSWTTDSEVSKSPTSPTESEHSSISSNFSLPIITCTPADEEDSDEESEGDVIVFAGDLEDNDDYVEELEELEEERREREIRGREMLFRLSRRSSDTATIRPSIAK